MKRCFNFLDLWGKPWKFSDIIEWWIKALIMNILSSLQYFLCIYLYFFWLGKLSTWAPFDSFVSLLKQIVQKIANKKSSLIAFRRGRNSNLRCKRENVYVHKSTDKSMHEDLSLLWKTKVYYGTRIILIWQMMEYRKSAVGSWDFPKKI